MTVLQIATPLGLAAVAAKGTLLVAIGWCGTLLLRRSPAVARHLLWLSVIVGVLLIPVLAQLAPMNVAMLPSVAVVPQATPAHTATRTASRAVSGEPAAAVVMGPPAGSPLTVAKESRRSWISNYGSFALALWITIASVLVGRFLIGTILVGRIIRRGRSLQSPELMRVLADAAAELELAARPRLVISDQVEMAFTFDAFAPTIVLPASAQEWSDERRRAVLLHELAHIRRRDLIGHTLASIACAMYWFNPFVWAAAARLRVESELASDDVVLQCGVRPSDYAQHLLDMVTSVGRRAPTTALAMARPKELEGRLVAILDRANRPRVLRRAQGAAMVGLLGLLTVSIAAVVPVPRASNSAPRIVDAPVSVRPAPRFRDSSTHVRGPIRAEAPSPAASVRVSDIAAPATAGLSDVAIATLLRYGTSAVINPMMMILQESDSLGLSGKQADSIATLNRWYMVRLNGIWSPVSSYYVSHPPPRHEASMNAAVRRAPQASMDALMAIVPDIMSLLSDEQRRKLGARVSGYLDARNLAAIGAGQSSAPAGVFLTDGGPYGARGQRRGGPGAR